MLSEGVWALDYYSVDGQGNQEITQTQTISLDMTAPTSMVNAPTAVADGVISITWTAADNLSGSDGVWLWFKFGLTGIWQRSSLSYQSGDSGLFSFASADVPGTYCFATQARDVAGNEATPPTGAGMACTSYGETATHFFIYLPVILK